MVNHPAGPHMMGSGQALHRDHHRTRSGTSLTWQSLQASTLANGLTTCHRPAPPMLDLRVVVGRYGTHSTLLIRQSYGWNLMLIGAVIQCAGQFPEQMVRHHPVTDLDNPPSSPRLTTTADSSLPCPLSTGHLPGHVDAGPDSLPHLRGADAP